MPKFRKKPRAREVDAEQFVLQKPVPPGVCYGQYGLCEDPNYSVLHGTPHLHTIHNGQTVLLEDGDWVVAEADGRHFYPVKPDIFEANYELIDEQPHTAAALHAQYETK